MENSVRDDTLKCISQIQSKSKIWIFYLVGSGMLKQLNNPYIKELDALRFVAILFVVINHLGAQPELFIWKPVVDRKAHV